MAQSGLHGLIGLALTQMGGQEAEGFESRTGAMKWGFVVGNIVPDVDLFLYPFLFKFYTLKELHRTWSHSLVTQAVICLLAYFLWARRNQQRQGLVSGLWLGMLVHSATDLLMWFAPVDLLWPLGKLGLVTSFNAWAPFNPDGWGAVKSLHILQNLMGAGEFLFLGLFFRYLIGVLMANKIEVKHVRFLRGAEWVMYLLTLVAAVLAFVLSKPGDTTYTFVIYPALLIAGFPIAGWALWHLREAIASTPPLIRRQAA